MGRGEQPAKAAGIREKAMIKGVEEEPFHE